jgi:hypothetical protein
LKREAFSSIKTCEKNLNLKIMGVKRNECNVGISKRNFTLLHKKKPTYKVHS